VLVALAGLLLSGAAAWYQTLQNQHLMQQRLQAVGAAAAEHMQQHLGRYQDALQGLRRGADSRPGPHGAGRTQSLPGQPGARAGTGQRAQFRFCAARAAPDEAAFVREQWARQPDFYVREFSRHPHSRYVVQAYRALDGGQPLQGLDLGSKPCAGAPPTSPQRPARRA
jgi:type II secretory pathway pseudopilin PulG